MATLVYKMTHRGDPDPNLACWGVQDCMGQIRDWDYDAVIGVGAPSWWRRRDPPSREGELIWIGIGPHMTEDSVRGSVVRFEYFLYLPEGELLRARAPNLARRMFVTNRACRFMRYGFGAEEQREIENILERAKLAGPCAQLSLQAADSDDGAECRQRQACRRIRREPGTC